MLKSINKYYSDLSLEDILVNDNWEADALKLAPKAQHLELKILINHWLLNPELTANNLKGRSNLICDNKKSPADYTKLINFIVKVALTNSK